MLPVLKWILLVNFVVYLPSYHVSHFVWSMAFYVELILLCLLLRLRLFLRIRAFVWSLWFYCFSPLARRSYWASGLRILLRISTIYVKVRLLARKIFGNSRSAWFPRGTWGGSWFIPFAQISFTSPQVLLLKIDIILVGPRPHQGVASLEGIVIILLETSFPCHCSPYLLMKCGFASDIH